jgi:hypothetical protein
MGMDKKHRSAERERGKVRVREPRVRARERKRCHCVKCAIVSASVSASVSAIAMDGGLIHNISLLCVLHVYPLYHARSIRSVHEQVKELLIQQVSLHNNLDGCWSLYNS